MRRVRRAEAGGFLTGLLVTLVILGLAGVVAYLLSDINARRYRLHVVHNELVVEKGRFFPVGFQPFVPNIQALANAYAPLPLPEGERVVSVEMYDDRADLDRALFSLLAGWARKGLDSKNGEDLERATAYIERCELLPGLSEQQRIDLKTLRADLAYKHGRSMIDQMDELLVRALQELELAQRLGTSRPTDAERWVAELQRRLHARGYGHGDAPFGPAGLPPGSSTGPSKMPQLPTPTPEPTRTLTPELEPVPEPLRGEQDERSKNPESPRAPTTDEVSPEGGAAQEGRYRPPARPTRGSSQNSVGSTSHPSADRAGGGDAPPEGRGSEPRWRL